MRTRLGMLGDLACHLGVVAAVLGGLGLVAALHPREEPGEAGVGRPEHARTCRICRSPYRFDRRGPGLLTAMVRRPVGGNPAGVTREMPRGGPPLGRGTYPVLAPGRSAVGAARAW